MLVGLLLGSRLRKTAMGKEGNTMIARNAYVSKFVVCTSDIGVLGCIHMCNSVLPLGGRLRRPWPQALGKKHLRKRCTQTTLVFLCQEYVCARGGGNGSPP